MNGSFSDSLPGNGRHWRHLEHDRAARRHGLPLQFTIKEPVEEGDRTMDIDLTKGYHLMCAAGDMDETGQEPLRHRKVKCS